MLDATNLSGALAGRLAGVPVVALGLRSLHPGARGWPSDSPLTKVYDALDARCVDALIVNSQAGRDSFLSAHPDFPAARIHVVRNAVVPAVLNDGGSTRHSPPVILWLGRVTPEKRPDLFVSMLEGVRDAGVLFEAWVCGDGEALGVMRSLVESAGLLDRVRFPGTVAEVGKYFASASVFVLCSDVEGLPNSILEAQVNGCPVVATAVGGVPEIVESGVTGFLVPPGDAPALQARVRELLADTALASRLAAAARDQAIRNFPQDRMLDEVLAVYRQAAAPAL